MIGNECPECGKRLEGQTCSCGWRGGAINKLMRECTACNKQRPAEVAGMAGTYPCEHCGAVSANFCHQCGTRSGSTTPMDDGRRCCPTCRLAAVRAVASAAMDLCVDCGVPVAIHLSEFRDLCKRIAMQTSGKSVPAEWYSRPSLLERAGLHRPRNKAVAARLAEERA